MRPILLATNGGNGRGWPSLVTCLLIYREKHVWERMSIMRNKAIRQGVACGGSMGGKTMLELVAMEDWGREGGRRKKEE